MTKFKNKEAKMKVMKNKSKLKDERKRDNVFIEHDIAKDQQAWLLNCICLAFLLRLRDLM